MRERLREAFGSVAELYDRARPPYPDEIFDDVRALTDGVRLLEVGCGTGQATRPLLERGFDVTCVELSPELAAIARCNAPGAAIVVADVERWEAPEFDVVAAFTAFHWLAPESRFATAARLGRALVVVHTHHVRNDDPFWLEAQADYDAVTPGPENRPPPRPEEIDEVEIDPQLFTITGRRRYPAETTYSPDDYVALLGTFSGHLALPAEQREELLARLHARVAAQGSVRKLVIYELAVAQRR